jgi:hypothetical protein
MRGGLPANTATRLQASPAAGNAALPPPPAMRYRLRMPRIPIAVVLGLAGLAVYIALAVTLADWIDPAHLGALRWLVQPLYFLAAGLLWVIPIRWLMLWAARR